MTSSDELVEQRHQWRVLLLPPTGRDAEAISKVLAAAQIECEICGDLAALCLAISAGAGAAIVSEEALLGGPEMLQSAIAAQPVWSDLPIVVLSRSGAESPALSALLGRLGNVNVLERPVRISTLLSVVQSSLRARARQYQARDHYIEREAFLASERLARNEAERASHLKDEFLATLSHELRTPLNAILGWSQILAMDGTDTDEIREGIKIIQRNAKAQAQIIEDLLDMSAIISGKIRLHVEDVNLAEVIRLAVETVQPAVDARGIELTVALDPLVGKISGDAGRLQQVFWNLLSNAAKFTPRQGAIHVSLERMQSHIQVRVQDTGEGIKPEFLAHVFDRFRQENATTTRRHGGLGLGLAIVKQLVELHGGSITATSAGAGQGATFVVGFPIKAVYGYESDADDRSPQVNLTTEDESLASLAGLKVLVVDDEPDARALLQRLLEDRGATVLLADSAIEAYQIISSQPLDVLVSDIGMPQEDGYSLIRRVRQLQPERNGQIPAIALSAYVRSADSASALQAGFQQHLSKPVQASQLVSTLADIVAPRNA